MARMSKMSKTIPAMSFAITIITLLVATLYDIGFNIYIDIYIQRATAQGQEVEDESTSTNQTTTVEGDNIIQLSVTEEKEVYRWSNNEGINPTLRFIANKNNTVQIQNPTDEEHEMIIESLQDKELVSSEGIDPAGSGQLSFKPNMTGTFEYHCEYHPDTMKGIIEVVMNR